MDTNLALSIFLIGILFGFIISQTKEAIKDIWKTNK